MKRLKRFFSVPILCMLLGGFTSEAATSGVTLRTIGKGATEGGTVTVPVTVAGFTSKLSMQFSLQWDPAVLVLKDPAGLVLNIERIADFGLPGGAASDFNVTDERVNAGVLAMAWVTPDGGAKSVADGTVVVNVTFTAVGATGTSSAIRFVDSPTATLIDDVPPQKDEGTVIVEEVVVENTAPTISSIDDQTVLQDNATGAISFTIGDTETAVGSLTVSKASSDTTVVLAQDIVIGGTGANRTVTVTPVSGKIGFATITLTVTDGGGLTASESFKLTVGAPNNPPTITEIGDQVIWEGAASEFPFTVGDEENTASELTVTASSSNTDVIPADNLTFTGTDANRTLVITPVTGTEGSTLVTLTIKDTDQAETTDRFTVSVTKRRLYVMNSNGSPESDVTIPIVLSSQGDEYGVGFSIRWNSEIFTYKSISLGNDISALFLKNVNFTSEGRVGVGIALDTSGDPIPIGDQVVANLTLTMAAGVTGEGFLVEIMDASENGPTPLGVSGVQTDILLPVAIQDGEVTLPTGLEGDLALGTGEGLILINDWIKSGNIFVGNETIQDAAEFQRADVSPRVESGTGNLLLGDGQILINDWIQVGNYFVGNDPLTPAGGPVGPFGAQSVGLRESRFRSSDSPIRIFGTVSEEDSELLFRVSLESRGDVTAVGFSMEFDSQFMNCKSAVLDRELDRTVLLMNERLRDGGRIGFAVSQFPGDVFDAGSVQLLELRFEPKSSVANYATAIRFGDSPVKRGAANSVADLVNAVFEIAGDNSAEPGIAVKRGESGILDVELNAAPGTMVVLEGSNDLLNWQVVWSGEVSNGGRVQITEKVSGSARVQFYRVRDWGDRRAESPTLR